ncbi:brain-specific serine protease 4 isoform X3 [Canis lupus dingo]|uniref:brain-specific serine protease 4 isoform X3 n=1 Tax=Canis lupus dingo TaxID=286419 RepID=UPI0015F14817|nr:brain-specific serine protease 4 isoform X3 [Canis lupus dingo]XP_038525418.1 brain-specific serine protease 4 isoform X2 [Canis lupus familiaris]
MMVSRGPPAPGGGCLRIVTPLLLLASAAALRAAEIATPPACGKPQQLNRIVGGEDSTDAQWPWVVSLQKNGTHHCAGSLLSSRWVVTAAHCFKGNLNKPSEYSVLLGAWQLGNPGPRSQEVGIAWVLSHPVYSWREGSRADIALVRLEHSVRFSERILPICLPDSSVHLLPNTRCWIAGWGSVRDGGTASPLPGARGWLGTESGQLPGTRTCAPGPSPDPAEAGGPHHRLGNLQPPVLARSRPGSHHRGHAVRWLPGGAARCLSG